MPIYRCEACGREKTGPPAPFCEGGEMTHRRATMRPPPSIIPTPAPKIRPGRLPKR
jgi:hypothetical protein